MYVWWNLGDVVLDGEGDNIKNTLKKMRFEGRVVRSR